MPDFDINFKQANGATTIRSPSASLIRSLCEELREKKWTIISQDSNELQTDCPGSQCMVIVGNAVGIKLLNDLPNTDSQA
ncbi:MAG: hypothetical protein JJU33_10650 [Phycisphaerales bacterium]|nr:hypothetical protein [Phycisphaerales bacterium]